MATSIQDVLKIDLALGGVMLLGIPEEIEAFRGVVGSDVVVTDRGAFNLGKRIALGRERILIETDITPLVQTLTGIEYPERDNLSRFAEVVRHAIENTNLSEQHLQGCVCRVDLIYDQDSGLPATEYLANKMIVSSLQAHAGWVLKGGSCRVTFAEEEKQWVITVEPRFGSEETNTVFLSVARYRSEQHLPEMGDIEEILQEVWDQAHSFLKRLDEESNHA